jgi:microbial collagenase
MRLLIRSAGLRLLFCLLPGFADVPIADAHGEDWERINAIPADLRGTHDPHVQTYPLTPDRQPPLSATVESLRRSYDDADAPADVDVDCDLGAFAAATAAELPDLVRGAEIDCLNGLFYLDGPASAPIVGEAKMTAVADALHTRAPDYAGNNDDGIRQLILFLRAGYYLAFYYPVEVGSYGPGLVAALRPAIDAFTANAHFHDVNDDHGAVLTEFVILIDSSLQNAYALEAVRDILASYEPAHADYYYMLTAVNQCFWVLWRGHQNADFQQLVQGAGSGIVDTLSGFIYDNQDELATDRAFLITNAGGELARFLMYGGTLHDALHPLVLAILEDFPLDGTGGALYARVGAGTEYYDWPHCDYFGVCDFYDTLEAEVLPNSMPCSPTLRVRSQALTLAQLEEVCAAVGAEEAYFHAMLATGNVPVANDYNDSLEIVIFRSSIDYRNFSGILFGNSTNNGGIYLEGDAADSANQARFLSFQAEWLEPGFEVWNLTHEYVHYLDGRFDTAGNFADIPLAAPYSALWYLEGVAEYVSYSFRHLVYGEALAEAANPDLYTLTTLLDNEYADGLSRVYRWGYLAVRFMFERQRAVVDAMLTHFRNFDYGPSGYEQFVDSIRGVHDAEFRDWLVCFAAHGGDTSACDRIFEGDFEEGGSAGPPECSSADPSELGDQCARSGLSAAVGDPVEEVRLYALLPLDVSTLTLTASGGSGDADIYVRRGEWPTETVYDAASTTPGNEERVTIGNAVGGDYYHVLVKPNPSFSDVRVTSEWQ